jgi:ribosomal protein S18 acetylase RimI-like enzyme
MIAVELITPKNALVFKAARLRALQDTPTAFGSTYARESQLSDVDWLNRAAQCTSETSVGYLAMDAETACGIARATPDDQDLSVAWVESMWVAPSHRRLGIGRLLIDTILAWARSRGVRALKLHVTSNNEPAISFYQRLGFSPTGNTEPYPNDPMLVECEMSKTLP